ncbi:MAG: hypothetical protein NTX52_13090, partial [Planctomycetota bacterium]|nr:hypothetical protein [Planctomycetota bacterium]
MFNLTNTILAAENPTRMIGVAVLVIAIFVVVVCSVMFLKFFRLWLQAKLSRADVKFSELIG